MDTQIENCSYPRHKKSAFALAMLVGVWCALCGQAAAQDPVLGTWRWGNTKQTFTLRDDGAALQKGRTGKWVLLTNNPSAPKYQINWDHGKFLDTLELRNGNELVGQNQDNYKLRATRVGPPPPTTLQTFPTPTVAPTPPAPAFTTAPASCIDRFSEQLPKAAEWTLAPLEIPVPAAIRGTVVQMATGLREEAAKTPQVSATAYRSALNLCQLLVNELNERDALLRKNAQLNGASGLSEAWKKNWDDRLFVIGPMLEKSYGEFREAVRVSPRSASAASERMIDRRSDFEIPALPLPSSEPTTAARRNAPRQEENNSPETAGSALESNNGGLNRGAYDQRRIWSWRYGRSYWIYR